MKDEDKELLKTWEVCTCAFCGNMGKDIPFILYGVEAHRKDKSKQIIKICVECANDWVSTYRR